MKHWHRVTFTPAWGGWVYEVEHGIAPDPEFSPLATSSRRWAFGSFERVKRRAEGVIAECNGLDESGREAWVPNTRGRLELENPPRWPDPTERGWP